MKKVSTRVWLHLTYRYIRDQLRRDFGRLMCRMGCHDWRTYEITLNLQPTYQNSMTRETASCLRCWVEVPYVADVKEKIE